jgi:hypothetical protein
MLQRIIDYLRPPRLTTRAALHKFLSSEASYIAQRSTYEFTRNTLAWFGQSAFGDKEFNRVFAINRWEAYAAILADMVVLTRDWILQNTTASATTLDHQMLSLYRQMLAAYQLPVHRPEGWKDRIEDLTGRLALVGQRETPGRIARISAARVMDSIAVKSRNPDDDKMVVENAIKFGLISFYDRLRQQLDSSAIVASLEQPD